MMSNEIQPVSQYHQRGARLRSLAAGCVGPVIVESLLVIALQHEHMAKRCGL